MILSFPYSISGIISISLFLHHDGLGSSLSSVYEPFIHGKFGFTEHHTRILSSCFRIILLFSILRHYFSVAVNFWSARNFAMILSLSIINVLWLKNLG